MLIKMKEIANMWVDGQQVVVRLRQKKSEASSRTYCGDSGVIYVFLLLLSGSRSAKRELPLPLAARASREARKVLSVKSRA